LKEDDGDTAAAADVDVLDTDALESTLQQTVKALHTKQKQWEDEQKQVNIAGLPQHNYISHLVTVTGHLQQKAVYTCLLTALSGATVVALL